MTSADHPSRDRADLPPVADMLGLLPASALTPQPVGRGRL
jgi:hypothetical protein